MAKRLEQIESVLKRAVSNVLAHGLSDPRVKGLVSVTRIKVSPDLHEAYVYVSVMPKKQEKRTLLGLRHAAGHIHALVCPQVALRTVPRLDFRVDEQVKKELTVLASIQRGLAREEVSNPEPGRSGNGDGSSPESPEGSHADVSEESAK